MQRLFADFAWLVDGWHADVAIDIDEAGHFIALVPGSQRNDRERIGRWVLPGVPNLHSHAFQRAMAGMAERQTHPRDSFWTWREVMYGFAQRVGPEALQAIAAQLYLEMLEAGYTHVCEFHYLHHDVDGSPYADPATMSRALLAAAEEVGIGMTLLPVLYQTGGFDGRALDARQRRFGCSVEQYLDLLDVLDSHIGALNTLGICFHSLRAVPEHNIRAVLEARPLPCPIHIHIAEQTDEVEECAARRGARPVRWLLDHFPVDARWTLVHATHVDADEVRDMAWRNLTVGLCPTTEANLGDGLFPLADFITAGGQWGIGSDSHISVSPVEELRWLEYGQRLLHRRRNLVGLHNMSCGESLLSCALAGGAHASGVSVGFFEDADEDANTRGSRADLVVLDEREAVMLGATRKDAVDRWIFSGNRSLVRDVMVAGRWRVRDGHHAGRQSITRRFDATMMKLIG